MKNRKNNSPIYFALENIEDSYGGPIRSTLALMRLLSERGFQTNVLQANSKINVKVSNFFKHHTIVSFWNFIFRVLFSINKIP